MRVRLRNGYTRAYSQIMQHTHTHKPVTGRIEAKELLSRWRQSNYRVNKLQFADASILAVLLFLSELIIDTNVHKPHPTTHQNTDSSILLSTAYYIWNKGTHDSWILHISKSINSLSVSVIWKHLQGCCCLILPFIHMFTPGGPLTYNGATHAR